MEDERLHPDSRIIIQTQDTLRDRLKEYLEELISGLELHSMDDDGFIKSERNKEIHIMFKSISSLEFIFRHVHRFYITQRRELDFTWEMMEQLILECNLNMDSLSFRCVVHPKSLVDSIISVIPQHIRLATKGFSHILSVLVFQDEEGNTSYDFGIAPKEYLFDFDEAIAKVDKDNQISRAQYKLMEALDRTKTKNILTRDSFALDIGASPGGWSIYLSNIVKTVFAVDPADLRVEKDNIIHIKKRVQDAIDSFHNIQFDIVVSDMTEEPQTTIDVIQSIDEYINHGGVIIITCKFPKRTQKNIEARLAAVLDHFKITLPNYKVLRALHLLSNYNERCIIAQKI